jgi:hypothetical protein
MVKDHLNEGTVCGIEPSAVPIMVNLIEKFKPQLIVELGIYRGGLTKYFAKAFPQLPIYAIDLVWQISKEDETFFREKSAVTFIITRQIFRNELILPMLLSLPLRKFFFCDNGKKDEEVMTYAGYLRPGDMLGVHDWGSEIDPQKVEHILKEFDADPVNLEFDSTPGTSELRFFYKKKHSGCENVPNDYS